MQAYSDPSRESDPHALPDVEVFEVWTDKSGKRHNEFETVQYWDDDPVMSEDGWYYWSCFPGCLPDSDPIGPFNTEAEALADAQQGAEV
jgi:hypothetical protein